ncbi:hypothetical protein DPMN_146331 [Dreissena polymorpha]|uniref:Uncharacterized protein n=1 Tax=Dreissena polymorpha TaxID=45954 RepID=A0A9D4J284_DREPO|nr:hypothetical protein DPMN_146331 [Dreissena polymorpha]
MLSTSETQHVSSNQRSNYASTSETQHVYANQRSNYAVDKRDTTLARQSAA